MARWIAPSVARATRVCVYDQARHGRSDAAPRSCTDAAGDLHVLLQRARIAGPYVIAGHSLGGAYALSYTHRYPAEVAGLAMLDSMHPQQATRSPTSTRYWRSCRRWRSRASRGCCSTRKTGSPVAQARQFVRDVPCPSS